MIDITNPLTADYMGLTIGHGTSAAEEIARAVPEAALIKGFNTVFAQVLAEGADFGVGRRVPVFLTGDHAEAKHQASALASSLGFEVIDAGGLNICRGYGAGLGTSIAPTWLRKA